MTLGEETMRKQRRSLLTEGVRAPSSTSPASGDYGAEVLALDPVAYWRLDGNFNDAVPPGLHPLILRGGVTTTPPGARAPLVGYPGNRAARFNGINGVAFAPSLCGRDFSQQATLLAWVRFALVPSDVGHIASILGKSGFGQDLNIQGEPDNRFHFYVATGSPIQSSSTTVVQPEQWYFVVATYAANGQIDLYVNGTLENTLAIFGIVRQENLNPVALGADTVFPGRFFPGDIAEAAIFDQALTGIQIQNLYWAATGDREEEETTAGRIEKSAVAARRKALSREIDPSWLASVQRQPLLAITDDAFTGTWANLDGAKDGWIRLDIGTDGKAWSIRAWADSDVHDEALWREDVVRYAGDECHMPGPFVPPPATTLHLLADTVCDTALKYGIASWDHGFVENHLTLRLEGDDLLVEDFNVFKDGSGRSNYRRQDKFKKVEQPAAKEYPGHLEGKRGRESN
jgi:Concanavalin A-like lectin/glucanases superfamily